MISMLTGAANDAAHIGAKVVISVGGSLGAYCINKKVSKKMLKKAKKKYENDPSHKNKKAYEKKETEAVITTAAISGLAGGLGVVGYNKLAPIIDQK